MHAKRFNQGKVDLTLVPAEASIAEARVWTYGASLYGRDNWRKLWGANSRTSILGSLLRHALAIQSGEDRDPESGELHAAHIRCNAAMLIALHTQELNELEEII